MGHPSVSQPSPQPGAPLVRFSKIGASAWALDPSLGLTAVWTTGLHFQNRSFGLGPRFVLVALENESFAMMRIENKFGIPK